MPNYKIFQDAPDRARVKIYGANNTALNTDDLGNLTITSTGLAITAPANGLTITSTGLSITAPANGLTITSTGLSITAPANGLTITSTGLSITAPANGLLVTSSGLAMAIATTDVSAIRANITDTAGSADVTYQVLGARTWSFGVVNASLVANAQARVKLQISPDGTTWNDEVDTVTINQNAMSSFVSSIFLKYARVFYSAVSAGSAVTLNIYFQGQL